MPGRRLQPRPPRAARIDAETLDVVARRPAPAGTVVVTVHGPMGTGTYLCTVRTRTPGSPDRCFVVGVDDLEIPALEDMAELPVGGPIHAGDRACSSVGPGERVELWDLADRRRLAVLSEDSAVIRYWVQDDSVYLSVRGAIRILDCCLATYR